MKQPKCYTCGQNIKLNEKFFIRKDKRMYCWEHGKDVQLRDLRHTVLKHTKDWPAQYKFKF